jgi:hypothetical protein
MATETSDSLRTARSDNGRSPVRTQEAAGPPIAVGLIAAGLGLWAWSYLGPDLRRYIKMSSM